MSPDQAPRKGAGPQGGRGPALSRVRPLDRRHRIPAIVLRYRGGVPCGRG